MNGIDEMSEEEKKKLPISSIEQYSIDKKMAEKSYAIAIMSDADFKPIAIEKRYMNCRTAIDAIHKDSPKLSELIRIKGLRYTQIVIVSMLESAIHAVGVKNGLDDNQYALVVNMLTTDNIYKSLTLADLNIVCMNLKYGKYEELYENIGTDKLFKWLNKYICERDEAYMNDEIKKNELIKNNKSQDIRDMDFIKKLYQKNRSATPMENINKSKKNIENMTEIELKKMIDEKDKKISMQQERIAKLEEKINKLNSLLKYLDSNIRAEK